MLRYSFSIFYILLILTSCGTSKRIERRKSKQILETVTESAVFDRAYTGFILQDAVSGRTLCASNADRYFTPASNTKILTLATCLHILGDSLTAMQYARSADGEQLIMRGVADPTFLHPDFKSYQPAFAEISRQTGQEQHNGIIVDESNWHASRFGAGWSWDDYNEAYSAERSAFPVFGNCMVLQIRKDGAIYDGNSEQYLGRLTDTERRTDGEKTILREAFSNTIRLPQLPFDTTRFKQTIPYRIHFLNNTSQNDYFLNWALQYKLPNRYIRGINLGSAAPTVWQNLSSWPVDSVYRKLMYQSDNFIAEHLLLQCAWKLSDSLQEGIAIREAITKIFPVSTTPPRWVDGSGLSRYNLVTPRYLTAVLRQLYMEQPRTRLFNLFPAGGVQGTLQNWYSGPDGQPFVYAKTGSMSGVNCLSGYLITKSNKVLIFSFMHNNFVGSNKAWKAEMQRILVLIREEM